MAIVRNDTVAEKIIHLGGVDTRMLREHGMFGKNIGDLGRRNLLRALERRSFSDMHGQNSTEIRNGRSHVTGKPQQTTYYPRISLTRLKVF